MKYYLVKLTSKNYSDIEKMSEILFKNKFGTYLSISSDKIILKYDYERKEMIRKVKYELEFYTREDLIPLFIGLLKVENIPTEEFSEFEVERVSTLFEKYLKETLKETKPFGFELKKKTKEEVDLDSVPKDNYSVQKLHEEYYKKEG